MNSRLRPSLGATALSAVMLLATSALALAQDAAAPAAAATPPPPAINSGDTAWMLTSSVLVLAMLVPGLALFYGGMVRKKNALAVLMQCTFAAGILSVIWCAVAYSLAFTEGNPFFGGFSKVMLAGIAGHAGTFRSDHSRIRLRHVPDDLRHHQSSHWVVRRTA